MARIETDTSSQTPAPRHEAGSREAFEVALDLLVTMNPQRKLDDGRVFTMVPKGFEFREITDPDRLSSRIKSVVTFDERESLIDYLKRYALAGSIIVADFDRLAAIAEIDHHEVSADNRAPGAVGAMRHTATLQLRPSEEWTRWDEFEGEFHSQDDFALFLEENATDVLDPDSATMIEISRDLEAVQNAGFKSSVRLDNGDRAFIYETETTTKNEVRVPTRFKLSIPLYQGEPPEEIEARLRWRPTGGGIVFKFEWHRVEYVRQAWFRQIVTSIVENSGVPAFYGRR